MQVQSFFRYVSQSLTLLLVTASVASAQSPGTIPWFDATHNFVTISVAGGPPVPISFDTGSVGLMIYESALGKDALYTKDKPFKRNFPGRYYNVRTATGIVSIGGLSTTKPIKFTVVTSIVCTSPGCTYSKTSAQLANIRGGNDYGIMGVGFGYSTIGSALLQLPAPYNAGYVVSNASGVSLGVSTENGFSKPLQLASATQSVPDSPYRTYSKMFEACFTVTGTPLKDTCMQSIFDTGNQEIALPSAAMPTIPNGPAASQYRIPNILTLQFASGRKSTTFPLETTAETHANFGIPLLIDYDVEVNYADGTYRFREHAPSGIARKTNSLARS